MQGIFFRLFREGFQDFFLIMQQRSTVNLFFFFFFFYWGIPFCKQDEVCNKNFVDFNCFKNSEGINHTSLRVYLRLERHKVPDSNFLLNFTFVFVFCFSNGSAKVKKKTL